MEQKKSLSKVLSVRVMTQLNNPPQTTAFQKLLILIGAAIFVALCSVTAGLPLNLPRHQDSQSPVTAAATNDGDTAWMIVATFLGFFVGPTIAYLFNNFYGRSNMTLIHTSFIIAGIITVLWIVTTFALIYGKKSAGEEYKILAYPINYYMFAHVDSHPSAALAPTIPLNIFAIYELGFAILTAIIIAAAVIERVTVYGLISFLTVWHVIVYAPIAFIVWNPNGYFKTNEIIDFSGGIVVNMLAGITIVVLHFYLNFRGAPKAEPVAAKDSEGLLINALLLWFLSFGLTAGKAHAANAVAAQSVVNTIACVMTSILINFLSDLIHELPADNMHIVNAILLGIVSAFPCSGFVSVGGAMVITIITVIGSRWFARYFLNDGKDGKGFSAATIFGLGGSISFLLTALLSYDFINPQGHNGLTAGYQTTLRHHTAAVLAMWSVGTLSVLFLVFLMDLFVPISKSEQTKTDDFAPTELGPARPSSFFNHSDVHKHDSTVVGNNNQAAPVARDEEVAEVNA